MDKETQVYEVHLLSQSSPMVFRPSNTYTKDGMFCVMVGSDGFRTVYKFPLCNIFRVVERNYG